MAASVPSIALCTELACFFRTPAPGMFFEALPCTRRGPVTKAYDAPYPFGRQSFTVSYGGTMGPIQSITQRYIGHGPNQKAVMMVLVAIPSSERQTTGPPMRWGRWWVNMQSGSTRFVNITKISTAQYEEELQPHTDELYVDRRQYPGRRIWQAYLLDGARRVLPGEDVHELVRHEHLEADIDRNRMVAQIHRQEQQLKPRRGRTESKGLALWILCVRDGA